MCKSTFMHPGDPSLNCPAAPVLLCEIPQETVRNIIEQMLQISQGERGSTKQRGLVGLAAPQIGIDKRIIIVDVGIDAQRKNWGDLRVFINPVIKKYSKEKELGREGCFSVDKRVIGAVPRSTTIEIEAYNQKGEHIQETLTDYTARIFQHEVDHLEGIRFPDRVGKEGALHWVLEAEFEMYRENWETWPCHCSRELWVAMKEGREFTVPTGDEK